MNRTALKTRLDRLKTCLGGTHSVFPPGNHGLDESEKKNTHSPHLPHSPERVLVPWSVSFWMANFGSGNFRLQGAHGRTSALVGELVRRSSEGEVWSMHSGLEGQRSCTCF